MANLVDFLPFGVQVNNLLLRKNFEEHIILQPIKIEAF